MKKLVAYITTGFPDIDFTVDAAQALAEAGVDILELGVPFSDPVADGPVIEEANLLALQNGFKIADLLEISPQITSHIETLWMGYFNPFYHRGIEKILSEAAAAKVSGFIIPDLPYEEATPYKPLFERHDMALIDFVAPTDTKERIETITKGAKKFIYLVAYAGITGSDKSEDLSEVIENIKASSGTPLYLGFGVDKETAKKKAEAVDGVIVGSAFVRIMLDETLAYDEKIREMQTLARTIKEEINS